MTERERLRSETYNECLDNIACQFERSAAAKVILNEMTLVILTAPAKELGCLQKQSLEKADYQKMVHEIIVDWICVFDMLYISAFSLAEENGYEIHGHRFRDYMLYLSSQNMYYLDMFSLTVRNGIRTLMQMHDLNQSTAHRDTASIQRLRNFFESLKKKD